MSSGKAAHAELSASGSERWLKCPGSVMLSRGIPDPPSSSYALEGTEAHQLLEWWLENLIECRKFRKVDQDRFSLSMQAHVFKAVEFFRSKMKLKPYAELVVEEKLSLGFIHKDMFGTADVQIIDDFNRLEVWDYKHGAGKKVTTTHKENGKVVLNTQLIYYALASAYKHNFNFKDVVIGIYQPRIGKTPHESTTISMKELKKYIGIFSRGVDRVFAPNPKLNVGQWCHWCKARNVCPKQYGIRAKKDTEMFDDL